MINLIADYILTYLASLVEIKNEFGKSKPKYRRLTKHKKSSKIK